MTRRSSLRLYALIALAYGGVCWIVYQDNYRWTVAKPGPAIMRAIATTSRTVSM